MQLNSFTIYLLKGGNKVYVGKTKGKRISAVFSRHRCGKHMATQRYFAKPYPAPDLYILSRQELLSFEAYKTVLAYIRLFRESGYEILNCPSSIARSGDLKEDTQQIFEKIKVSNVSHLLQSTKLAKVTDGDITEKSVAAETATEKCNCQLTIRLTKKEREQFRQIGTSLNLNQHETLLYLYDKCNQNDPIFLDLEGDTYLRAILNSYRAENEKLKNLNAELQKKVLISRTDKKNKLEKQKAQMQALQHGIKEYFRLMESACKIPVSFEIGYYKNFPEKDTYKYPDNEGVYIFRPQEILRSKGRWGALFLLGIGDNEQQYMFRFYPKSYYAGENIANSVFGKRGSVWLVGCEKSKDNAMDLIYAFPLEVGFRFNGPEEYGSKMNRDIATWMKEISSYQDF